MPDSRNLDVEARINALRSAHQDDRAFLDALCDEAEASVNMNPALAAELSETIVEESRNIDYAVGEAVGQLILAASYYIRQNNRLAFPLALEAYAKLDALGVSSRLGQSCTVLAGLYYTSGNHQKALEFGHEALERSNAVVSEKPNVWLGWANYLLGDVYRATGDPERARSHYQQTYDVFSNTDEAEGKARGLLGIGVVCRSLGDYETSEKNFTRALDLMSSIDDSVGMARTLSELGLLRQVTGRLDEALELLERSLEIRRELKSPLIVATCLIDMGKLLTEMGRPEKAIASLTEALQICQELDHKPRAYAAHKALAEALSKQGDYRSAITHLEEFQRLRQEVSDADLATRLENLEISLEAAAAQKEAHMIRSHNEELQDKNTELARLLDELKEAQEMLVQSEKMASLGQLTAGIAHEIKNPLNFVNNFSTLTKDLALELSEEIVGHREASVGEVEGDLLELANEIISNAERVLEHGRRAIQIVNSMLVHTRQSGGKKTDVAVNELVSNCVDLAYHGFLVNHQGCKVVIDQQLAPDAGSFKVIEDEVARVITNIMNNAFYAVRERVEASGEAFEPRVRVESVRRAGSIEIKVTDNGGGIPDDLKNKVFEPFFTTKPSGSGTGLGLSQSYEIITKRHGGTLTVADTEGGGATLILQIPA